MSVPNKNILSSVLYTLPFLGYQPLNISNGEPALTAANLTKQTMLGPPFTWWWNRDQFTIPIPTTDPSGNPIVPAQDYLLPVTDLGFLEKVWLQNSDGEITEIKIKLALAQESTVQRPASMAIHMIDPQTNNLIIRLNTIPDQAYTLLGTYQMEAGVMTSMASKWAPIPDQLSYIYEAGFLSFVAMLTKDARVPMFRQQFAAHLLGAQDGLTSTQRNIFIGNFLGVLTEPQRATAEAQQGVAARQV
jgi:hypothetical protein